MAVRPRGDTNEARFVPDMMADRAIVRVSKNFTWLVIDSLAVTG